MTDRDEIARIINPQAFTDDPTVKGKMRERRYALELADAILALRERAGAEADNGAFVGWKAKAATPTNRDALVEAITKLRDECRHEATKTDRCYTCYTDQAAHIARRLDAALSQEAPDAGVGS